MLTFPLPQAPDNHLSACVFVAKPTLEISSKWNSIAYHCPAQACTCCPHSWPSPGPPLTLASPSTGSAALWTEPAHSALPADSRLAEAIGARTYTSQSTALTEGCRPGQGGEGTADSGRHQLQTPGAPKTPCPSPAARQTRPGHAHLLVHRDGVQSIVHNVHPARLKTSFLLL